MIPVEERAPAMLACVQAVELAVAVGVVTLDRVAVQRARQRIAVEDNPCKRLPQSSHLYGFWSAL